MPLEAGVWEVWMEEGRCNLVVKIVGLLSKWKTERGVLHDMWVDQ